MSRRWVQDLKAYKRLLEREDQAPTPKPVDPPLIELGPLTYLWMGICGIAGLGCFLYGIYEATDLFFYMSFCVWGAALVPLVFSMLYHALEIVLKSTALALSILGILALAIIGYAMSRTDMSLISEVLRSRYLMVVIVVLVVCVTLLVALVLIGKVVVGHLSKAVEQDGKKLDVNKDIDLAELDASRTLELRKLELENQIKLKQIELEQERLRIESARLALEERRVKLLEHDPERVGADGTSTGENGEGSRKPE